MLPASTNVHLTHGLEFRIVMYLIVSTESLGFSLVMFFLSSGFLLVGRPKIQHQNSGSCLL